MSLTRSRLARAGVSVAIALLVFLANSHTASAHAKPTTSTPSPNQNMTTAPSTVTIEFGENVKPDGSDIIIYDKDGKQVSTDHAKVDTADLKKMTVPMKGDDSESYLVVWHTVSADDGESAIGAFSFGVNAKADDLPSASTASGQQQGITPLFAALLGLLGVGLGAAGMFAYTRRQMPAA